MGIMSKGYETLQVFFGGAGQCCSFCTSQVSICVAWSLDISSGLCSLYKEDMKAQPATGYVYGRAGGLLRRGWTTLPQWFTQVGKFSIMGYEGAQGYGLLLYVCDYVEYGDLLLLFCDFC